MEKSRRDIEKINQMSSKYIYVIKCNQYYKIGLAKNLSSRLSAIQSGSPYSIQCIVKFKCSEPKYCESMLHEIFNGQKIRGEWFLLDKQDILFIKQYLSRYSMNK